jgi:hypothetical protein
MKKVNSSHNKQLKEQKAEICKHPEAGKVIKRCQFSAKKKN